MRRFSPLLFFAVYALAMPLLLGVTANVDHLPMILERIWNPTAAAWAQAVGAIAAVGIAIYLPWNDRRIDREDELQSRLEMEVFKQGHPPALRVMLNFFPKQRSSGIHARVRLLQPVGASLLIGRMRDSIVMDGGLRYAEIASDENWAEISTSLTLEPNDPDKTLRGAFYVVIPTAISYPIRAQVRIEIWTMSDSQLILTRDTWISPIA